MTPKIEHRFSLDRGERHSFSLQFDEDVVYELDVTARGGRVDVTMLEVDGFVNFLDDVERPYEYLIEPYVQGDGDDAKKGSAPSGRYFLVVDNSNEWTPPSSSDPVTVALTLRSRERTIFD